MRVQAAAGGEVVAALGPLGGGEIEPCYTHDIVGTLFEKCNPDASDNLGTIDLGRMQPRWRQQTRGLPFSGTCPARCA